MSQQPPQFHLTTVVDAEVIDDRKPLADPFVIVALSIGYEDVAKAYHEGRGIEVRMRVGGTPAAIYHTMQPFDLSPNEVAIAPADDDGVANVLAKELRG